MVRYFVFGYLLLSPHEVMSLRLNFRGFRLQVTEVMRG